MIIMCVCLSIIKVGKLILNVVNVIYDVVVIVMIALLTLRFPSREAADATTATKQIKLPTLTGVCITQVNLYYASNIDIYLFISDAVAAVKTPYSSY